ncbi:hypothetical protein GXP70_18140 [Paenibacillus lycopersici]|uniref:Uncharacterized protein n=1 Tax=Paenibacillus lycopersici TaxID=2704462 RepID=A0A6C0G6T0_9BACL|nr:hypothetical protein [Paenibacillus lycopersici]QHT61705.1 hypothetical protein GXP70_18140 [Paenibacillus lycopersici]
MKLFELAIGTTRRYVASESEDAAYAIGTDPVKHPDISFLPFTITEVTVPGYAIKLTKQRETGDG